MVKVLDELTPDQLLQAEKDKSDGKVSSRRKALPATYGPHPHPQTITNPPPSRTDVCGRAGQTNARMV